MSDDRGPDDRRDLAPRLWACLMLAAAAVAVLYGLAPAITDIKAWTPERDMRDSWEIRK